MVEVIDVLLYGLYRVSGINFLVLIGRTKEVQVIINHLDYHHLVARPISSGESSHFFDSAPCKFQACSIYWSDSEAFFNNSVIPDRLIGVVRRVVVWIIDVFRGRPDSLGQGVVGMSFYDVIHLLVIEVPH